MIFVEIVCFLICLALVPLVLGFLVACWRGLSQLGLTVVLILCAFDLKGHPHDDSTVIFWIIGASVLGLILLEHWHPKGVKQS